MNKPKSGKRLAMRVVAEALLPVQAFRSLRASVRSLKRTATMIRTGKPSLDGELPAPKENVEESQVINEGKSIVMALGPRDRFQTLFEGLGWTDESLQKQKTAIQRTHTIRLSALYLAVLLLPGICLRYGWMPAVYDIALIAFLSARSIRSACYFTQLQERSLMGFKELWGRPDWWLFKRSFWFLG